MIKRNYLLWCFLGMMLLLTGCQKKEQVTQGDYSKEQVYRVEDLAFDDEQVNALMKEGDYLYAYGYGWNEETGGSEVKIWRLNEDGTIKEKNKITLNAEEGINTVKPDGKGNIFAIKNSFSVDSEGNYKEAYYFAKYTEKGELLFEKCLNDMPEVAKMAAESEYFYVSDFFVKDSMIYICVTDCLATFDEEGNFIKYIKIADGTSFENVTLYALANGKVAALSYEENGTYLAYADLELGEYTDKMKIPGASHGYSVYPAIGYDVYLVDSYGVYGYNIGEEEKTPLMNFVDSDFGSFNILHLVPISETAFFGTYDSMETGQQIAGCFTKVDASDVKEKKVLTLACRGLDWTIRMAVIGFNKSNEEYRISIKDYDALYNEDGDYLAGASRMNTDIMAGNMPDIIAVDASMPMESYISKGLIEDIKPYIEADEELDIDNYMPNVMEAFSREGKLYQIVPCYHISTIVAKASDVGAESGWSVQEAMELWEKSPQGTQLLPNVTRDYMLESCITMSGSQFVDWETGSCHFDTEGFEQLLEFIKKFPEEIKEDAYTEDYWTNYDSMWRENKVLAQMVTLYDFRYFNYLEKGTFGEEITMIGYPGEAKCSSAIVPNMQLAMSSQSKYKEGAFEFMRTFLTDEFQEKDIYGLPLSKKRMSELAQEATEHPYYTDEDGTKYEMPETYYIGDVEIVIDPMSQEEVTELEQQIASVTTVYQYDENLIQIIREEAAAFFAGQKPVKEVSDIIQSRVQIYINENR